MPQHVVKHGRDQKDRRHTLQGNQAQDLLGRVVRHANQAAVEQRGTKQDANAHGVKQRHHAEAGIALAILVLRDVRDRRRQLGMMAARNAFWPAGGARCVEHEAGRKFIRCRGPGDRRRLAQALESFSLTLAVGGDDQPAGIDLERSRGLRRGIAGGTVEGKRGGLGILETILNFIRRSTPAHRCEDDAEHMAGPIEGRHLVAVSHDDDEMFAGLKPHLLETAGHRFDLAVPLRVGAAAIAVDDRFRMRLAPDRDSECGAEIHRQGPVFRRFDAASSMAATIAA